ncbi:hypothetical protein C466_15724 [Halorubrum distributum JCM 10118]|uniref:Uncharacterized protein n=1 Tax=Halorubrum distributum JCM 10118 TaxID=1227468 RepID=M0ERW5_9EURY|nr:hypothetical protein [Halorubrum distributum]ELZ49843.1 hypothetical protein C466_15724 [Halorubrum distributum JCM 10118]
MEQPEPAEGWPDRPLSEAETKARFTEEENVVAVWVMDHTTDIQSVAAPPSAPGDAVVDIVVETNTGYNMYSFTRGQWMNYGTQRKDDEESPSMAGTLESYRVLTGEPESF